MTTLAQDLVLLSAVLLGVLSQQHCGGRVAQEAGADPGGPVEQNWLSMRIHNDPLDERIQGSVTLQHIHGGDVAGRIPGVADGQGKTVRAVDGEGVDGPGAVAQLVDMERHAVGERVIGRFQSAQIIWRP